jgi:hypothetical protein
MIRSGFRCECDRGGKPKIKLAIAGNDFVSKIEDEWRKALGGFQFTGCPWRCFSDPFVSAVTRAMSFYKSGNLDALYPDGVPHALVEGIRTYESIVNGVTNYDQRQAARERESKQRAAQESERLRTLGKQG